MGQHDFHSLGARQAFAALYGAAAADAPARWAALEARFLQSFGPGDTRLFSAPGRTEIGGNHTDHNNGRVLAAAVSLDTIAVARRNDLGVIRLTSEGYDGQFTADLRTLAPVAAERGTTTALLRGVAGRMAELGCAVGGFDAMVTSTVLKGSGLSSSAAFEVLVVTIMDGLYNGGRLSPEERAQVSKVVENVYFGKPSGLMDQMASSVGGLVTIDFADEAAPVVERVAFDFNDTNLAIVVTDTGGNHADLTHEYAAIPADMLSVAAAMGKERLREVNEAIFYARVGELRRQVGDRPLLRAMHFFAENDRVVGQAEALRRGDLDRFLALIAASGDSSWRLLQNVFVPGSAEQNMTLALALGQRVLGGQGACRVHGGGFAGTTLAFVPKALLSTYVDTLEQVFGAGACTVLSIRQTGATELSLKED